MDYFRTRSTYGHLPNFGLLFEQKLYLPNTTVAPGGHLVLGKWSFHWDKTLKHLLVGTVQQDACGNITFSVTECFEITHCTFQDYTKAPLVPKDVFVTYWPTMYQFDPMLSLIQIRVSDFYSQSQSTPPPPPPPPPPPQQKQKQTTKQPVEYFVCKTDKPDVYHVMTAQGQYVSSCLIPNIKISKFMYDTFEHKSMHELVRMTNLTRHEKTGKFIPTLF